MIDAGNGLARLDRVGIAARSEHDSHVGAGVEARGPRGQCSHRRLSKQPGQLFVEHGQHDLRFRIAEPHVELDDLGAVRGQHQPDIEKPAIRVSFALHPLEHGPHDLVDDPTFDLRRDERARRECSHPAGVRTSIVIEDPLVVLRRTERDERRAVGEDEIGGFLPDQKLFENESIAGASESPLDHQRLHRGRGCGAIIDDHDPLAGREAIRLQHQRISEPVALEPRERRARRVAHVVAPRSARCAAP